MRVDQLEPRPFVDLLAVRADARVERRRVLRRPRDDRPPVEVALEIVRHLPRRARSDRRVVRHRLERDALQRLRDLAARSRLGSRGCPARMAAATSVVACARVRHGAGHELVQDDAKRVDVRPRVDRLGRDRAAPARGSAAFRAGVRRADRPPPDRSRGSSATERPSSMMLAGFRSRCWMPRSCARWMASQTSRRIAARWRNSSEGASRPSSNPSTNSMMMTGGVASARNSNTCTTLGCENSASDLASRRNPARLVRIGGISTQDLRRDDAIELQVLELVDLAHPAGAEAFDRAEAFEGRQRRRLAWRGRGVGHSRHLRRRGWPRARGSGSPAIEARPTAMGRRSDRATSGQRPCRSCCSMSSASRVSRSEESVMPSSTTAASATPSPGQTPCGRRPRSCRFARRSPRTTALRACGAR